MSRETMNRGKGLRIVGSIGGDDDEDLDMTLEKAITGTTDVQNVINEVWSEQIEEYAYPERYMRQIVVVNTELLETGSSKVHIPKKGAVTAKRLAETESIIPQAMSYGELVLEPDEFGAGVEVRRKALKQAYRNVMEDASQQLGEALAQIEDEEIILAGITGAGATIWADPAYTDDDDIAADDIMTTAVLRRARGILRGGNYKGEMFAIINPAQETALLDDSQFIDASKYGDQSIVLTGEIGKYLGIRILSTNNVPSVANAGTVEVYRALLIGKRGLALALKENPEMDEDYLPKERHKLLTAVMMFETGVLNDYQVVCMRTA